MSTLEAYEGGRIPLPAYLLPALSHELHVPVDYFFQDNGPQRSLPNTAEQEVILFLRLYCALPRVNQPLFRALIDHYVRDVKK